MKPIRLALFLLFALLAAKPASAQNLKGGEITFDWTSGYFVNFYINIYTKPSLGGTPPYVLIGYSDGSTDSIPVTGGVNLSFDTKIYTLTLGHTFPGPGIYEAIATINHRMPNLVNVSNSYTESLYLRAAFSLSGQLATNSSPVFVYNQSDITFNADTFIHNANAVDANGDSISYSLVHPGTNNYVFPNATVNPVTGLFTMPALNQFGAYAVAIWLDEWRTIGNQPAQIATTMRNMTIETPLINSIAAADVVTNTSVFPNPFSEYTTITFPETFTTPVQLIFTDMHGREITRETVTGNRHLLQRNGMAAGFYLYRLENKGKLISRGKISVQ